MNITVVKVSDLFDISGWVRKVCTTRTVTTLMEALTAPVIQGPPPASTAQHTVNQLCIPGTTMAKKFHNVFHKYGEKIINPIKYLPKTVRYQLANEPNLSIPVSLQLPATIQPSPAETAVVRGHRVPRSSPIRTRQSEQKSVSPQERLFQ